MKYTTAFDFSQIPFGKNRREDAKRQSSAWCLSALALSLARSFAVDLIEQLGQRQQLTRRTPIVADRILKRHWNDAVAL